MTWYVSLVLGRDGCLRSQQQCQAELWTLSFERDVDKLENDMGTMKSGNVIEGCLEKSVLNNLGWGTGIIVSNY